MNCYAVCQKECDIYEAAACLSKQTKEQRELIDSIKRATGKYCKNENCGGHTTRAKHNGERKRICFNCGEGLR